MWEKYYLDSITFTGGGYLVNEAGTCPGDAGIPSARLYSDQGGIVDNNTQWPHQNEIALGLELDADEDKATPIVVANAAETLSIVSPPANGTLSGTAPNLTCTQATDYHGPDAFSYRANDGNVDSNTATVEITVAPVNDLPAVNAGGPYGGTEGAAITLGGASASDVDGDLLTYSWTVSPALCSLDNPSVLPPQVRCNDGGSY